MAGNGGVRISGVAERVGVSPWTLRALERKGRFLARRDWTGARRYSEEDIEKLRAIFFPPAEVERSGR